jgi:hypothetical protein
MNLPTDPNNVFRVWLPIGISVLALCVSLFNLGWSVYKEIILKARLRVRFLVKNEVTAEREIVGTYLSLKATNLGPGKVTLVSASCRVGPLWRRVLRKVAYADVWLDPGSTKLPVKLDVGESVDLRLPYGPSGILSTNATHIGVLDSFGRMHYAPAKDVRVARKRLLSEHPKLALTDLTEEW